MLTKIINTALTGTAFAVALFTLAITVYIAGLFANYYHNMQVSEVLLFGGAGISALLVTSYLLGYVWLKIYEEKHEII